MACTNVCFSDTRAGARKSGREGEARIVKPEERYDHMPHTQHYPVEDVLVDLLEVSEVYRLYGDVTFPPETAAVCLCVQAHVFAQGMVFCGARSWPLYMETSAVFLKALVNSPRLCLWVVFLSRRLFCICLLLFD